VVVEEEEEETRTEGEGGMTASVITVGKTQALIHKLFHSSPPPPLPPSFPPSLPLPVVQKFRTRSGASYIKRRSFPPPFHPPSLPLSLPPSLLPSLPPLTSSAKIQDPLRRALYEQKELLSLAFPLGKEGGRAGGREGGGGGL